MSGHRTCSAINLTSNASRCFFDVDIFMILMHAFALMRIYSGILLKSDFCMPLLSFDARAIALKRPPLYSHHCAFASICFTSARFHCALLNTVLYRNNDIVLLVCCRRKRHKGSSRIMVWASDVSASRRATMT